MPDKISDPQLAVILADLSRASADGCRPELGAFLRQRGLRPESADPADHVWVLAVLLSDLALRARSGAYEATAVLTAAYHDQFPGLPSQSIDALAHEEWRIRSPSGRCPSLEDFVAAVKTDDPVRLRESILALQTQGGPTTEQAGEAVAGVHVIGNYHIVRKLGEGGMGTVYEADQFHPLRRRVALKVIRTGLESGEAFARFESERHALSLMDHPCIARVLDAGVSSNGVPFVAMDLIRGVAITEFCEQNRLPLPARLSLFIDCCRAIHHAHQKGVLHRDITPRNVLVTQGESGPEVRVIDFGIAKSLNAQSTLTDSEFRTEHGRIVGTILYMSPEQALEGSIAIDVRSDVYSLGVLLFELLTATTPLTRELLRSKPLDRVLQELRDSESPRPSARLLASGQGAKAAASCQLDLRTFLKGLTGDLDWIALKALEKDRTRRYDSASHLADDVVHFLNQEPVSARPPSVAYRVRRAIQRHRIAFAVGTATSFLLVATFVGLSLAVIGLSREKQATQRRLLAEQKASAADQHSTALQLRLEGSLSLLHDVYDQAWPALTATHDVNAQRRLLEVILRYTDDIDSLVDGGSTIDPRSVHQLLQMAELVSTYNFTGDDAEVVSNSRQSILVLYQRATRLADLCHAQNPNSWDRSALRAHAAGSYSSALSNQGRNEEAVEERKRAVSILDTAITAMEGALAASQPTANQIHDLIIAHRDAQIEEEQLGRHEQQLYHAERALKLTVDVLPGVSNEEENLLAEYLAYQYAGIAYRDNNRPEDAFRTFLKVADLCRRMVDTNPADHSAVMQLWDSFERLSHICRDLGQKDNSLRYMTAHCDLARVVLDDHRRRGASDAEIAHLEQNLSDAVWRLASLYMDYSDPMAAMPLREEVVQLRELSSSHDFRNIAYSRRLAAALEDAIALRLILGPSSKAVQNLGKQVRIRRYLAFECQGSPEEISGYVVTISRLMGVVDDASDALSVEEFDMLKAIAEQGAADCDAHRGAFTDEVQTQSLQAVCLQLADRVERGRGRLQE